MSRTSPRTDIMNSKAKVAHLTLKAERRSSRQPTSSCLGMRTSPLASAARRAKAESW
jgi:hypothetical protein